MDPANEKVPYKSDIDINELINIDDVQEEYGLGPNGSLMYCMEYLENNISWLLEKLEKYIKEGFINDANDNDENGTTTNQCAVKDR
ncbi:GPN-loop GTPase 2 [Zancudomyces culisetae]|uniref:GPN-loop GTPase 2 n=1 Tax=Zancudomyces culisetae TaxID=1213189 RepID=A0A1R1PGG4_ZANCU|nr:GPN-loop GTPase 2 [Zancudomyces culisetae]|eukprot:OMH79942.1 GPN-loop GTPase 2 [Zancudomyces culisetae]